MNQIYPMRYTSDKDDGDIIIYVKDYNSKYMIEPINQSKYKI